MADNFEGTERVGFWGRSAGRRRFLRDLGTAGVSLSVPGLIAATAAENPDGQLPAGNAPPVSALPGKHPRLVLLNDRPINAETPADLLDDDITPAANFFVRNNGLPPTQPDASNWTLTVDGESALRPLTLSLEELQTRFTTHSYQLVLECGGNGRSEFYPSARGNQWSTGAVGCARWTGVRLRDVLESAGIRDDAVYVGYYGADRHLSGDPGKVPISRGVPMSKALEDETLIAWEMNGEPLPLLNGYPLRLVVGGWPASASGKWLTRISVRNRIHDGPKMGGQSYRVPCEPVAPGSAVPDEEMCIIEAMPVKSLITSPRSGVTLRQGETMPLRGHAWAGDGFVSALHVSTDFGQTWSPARLDAPANRLAWQHFATELAFPGRGYYEVWARATDATGRSQPMIVPGWNPRGYLNNACHRIAVQVV